MMLRVVLQADNIPGRVLHSITACGGGILGMRIVASVKAATTALSLRDSVISWSFGRLFSRER